MAVEVSSTRMGVEISWDPSGIEGEGGTPEPPETEVPGFPTHPIYEPPYVDNELPPHVDNSLPGGPPHPEHPIALPPEGGSGGEGEGGGVPSHPIYLPPYIDNSLPGGGDSGLRPDNTLPGDLEDTLTDEQKEQIKEFMFGNLPPTASPVGGEKGGINIAVQVFAQGQDGDWSNTAVQPNDGKALLSYPAGFSGESWVEVRALDGSIVDCGTIQVG